MGRNKKRLGDVMMVAVFAAVVVLWAAGAVGVIALLFALVRWVWGLS